MAGGDMEFIHKGSNYILNNAVIKANKVINGNELYEELKGVEFHKSTLKGDVVMSLFSNNNYQIIVKEYRTCFPWSSVLGYFSPKRPWSININTRKLNRSIDEIVGTLVHEAVHVVDYWHDGQFGHAAKWNSKRHLTAPYMIGNVAVKISRGL
jgi:hypothetical protein